MKMIKLGNLNFTPYQYFWTRTLQLNHCIFELLNTGEDNFPFYRFSSSLIILLLPYCRAKKFTSRSYCSTEAIIKNWHGLDL